MIAVGCAERTTSRFMNLLVMSSLQEQALDIHLCEPVENKTFVTNEDYVPKVSTPWQLPGRRRRFRKARTPRDRMPRGVMGVASAGAVLVPRWQKPLSWD
jgi:hypothetical protein